VGDGIAVWLGWNTGRIRGTNSPIRQQAGGVFRVSGDLIVEVRYFMTWREALEAAGAEEHVHQRSG
jgi:hypothetical protein